MKSLIIKSLTFVSLTVFLIIQLDTLFLDNTGWDVSTFNSFYEAERNDLNVVFIGSSHLNKGIDNYIVDANSNINSIKLSGGGMTISQVYYNLLEVLKRQTPELVVIETYCLIEPHVTNNKLIDSSKTLLVRPFNSEYYKRPGMVKYNEISKIYPENPLFHFFNIFRFNDKWTDDEVFLESLKAKYWEDPRLINQRFNKKTNQLSNNHIREFKNKNFSINNYEISENESLYLNKIIDLSKSKGFQILFFTTPVLDIYYEKTKKGFEKVSDQLSRIIEKHKHIKFYDLNQKVKGYDRFHFLPGKISYNQHLNYKGIIKTSVGISEYINSNYNFETKRNSTKQSVEDYLYSDEKLLNEKSFKGTIEAINNQKYVTKKATLNLIRIPESQKKLNFEGWMFHTDIESNLSTRKIALKKKNKFIFISNSNLELKKNKFAKPNKGKTNQASGFLYGIDKSILEKGRYKIHFVIESPDGKIHVKDTWRWLVIE